MSKDSLRCKLYSKEKTPKLYFSEFLSQYNTEWKIILCLIDRTTTILEFNGSTYSYFQQNITETFFLAFIATVKFISFLILPSSGRTKKFTKLQQESSDEFEDSSQIMRQNDRTFMSTSFPRKHYKIS